MVLRNRWQLCSLSMTASLQSRTSCDKLQHGRRCCGCWSAANGGDDLVTTSSSQFAVRLAGHKHKPHTLLFPAGRADTREEARRC